MSEKVWDVPEFSFAVRPAKADGFEQRVPGVPPCAVSSHLAHPEGKPWGWSTGFRNLILQLHGLRLASCGTPPCFSPGQCFRLAGFRWRLGMFCALHPGAHGCHKTFCSRGVSITWPWPMYAREWARETSLLKPDFFYPNNIFTTCTALSACSRCFLPSRKHA